MNHHWTDRLFDYWLDKLDHIDYLVDYYYERFNKRLNKLINKFDKVVDSIVSFPMHFYTFYRYITFPTNKVFIYIWKYLKKWYQSFDILCRKGIHILISEPGGGKTLSAYITTEIMYEKKGIRSYINSPFEKPRTDEYGRKYLRNILFKFDDIFGVKNGINGRLEGYQKKRFNSKKAKIVVWDEIHLIFNPRENRTGLYMLAWKPFLNNLLHYRHEGFHSHIMLSQLKVDIQLASISSYIHKPTTIIDVNYGLWLATGQFKMVPVKIKYETYKFKDEKMKLHKRWSRKVDYRHLEYYETLALKHTRNSIPLLNK